MIRVNIAARIWFSIGIFILGFIVSMGLQQVQGIETEKTVRTTSEVLFPSAQMNQAAEAAFDRAIRNSSDAVLIQDSEGLQHAQEEGFNAVMNLCAVAAIRGVSTEHSLQVMKLADSIEEFVVAARSTYAIMLRSPANLSQETQQRMRRLAYQTDVIKGSLKSSKGPVLERSARPVGRRPGSIRSAALGGRVGVWIDTHDRWRTCQFNNSPAYNRPYSPGRCGVDGRQRQSGVRQPGEKRLRTMRRRSGSSNGARRFRCSIESWRNFATSSCITAARSISNG